MPADRNTDPKRKPRNEHAPYKPRKPKVAGNKNPPKTSAQPVKTRKRSNLTLHDWMTVFSYIDKHPGISQDTIVDHFGSKAEGPLIFDQTPTTMTTMENQKSPWTQ